MAGISRSHSWRPSATSPRRSSGCVSGASNNSDLEGVLQHRNIHIKVCPEERRARRSQRSGPAVRRRGREQNSSLATDGTEFQAEDLNTGETVACDYPDFPEHFGVLPAARRHHDRQADPREPLSTSRRPDD